MNTAATDARATRAPHSSRALPGMERDDFLALCRQLEVKPSHAERLTAFVHRKGITDLDAMYNLPRRLIDHLRRHTRTPEPEIAAAREADDGTRKLLLRMEDGREVETVLIPAEGRLTQCLSTQVGCAVDCRFCLTATAGLTRNLTAAEMVAQILTMRRHAGRAARNLVLMGMGEPLHNFEEVARFVRIAVDPLGMAFSPRRVTLSTAGLVPGIERMIEQRLNCSLAVSLNATTDAVRDAIMPINRKYPIGELMRAVRAFADATGRRVLIEYVLLAGVNDTPADAERLSRLVEGLDCTVNLLPFNPHPGSRFGRPDAATISAFRARLIDRGHIAVVRASRGDGISAACGQLKTETAARRRAGAA